MGMWEIDKLLTSSIVLVRKSVLDADHKKHIVWNLERLPEVYGFDAGGFEKSEESSTFEYQNMHPYELGVLMLKEAKASHVHHLIYDWSAFLLNYWNEYFSEIEELDRLKSHYLEEMKTIFGQLNFSDYRPTHASLTLYANGNKWFSEEQNGLIRWYCGE